MIFKPISIEMMRPVQIWREITWRRRCKPRLRYCSTNQRTATYILTDSYLDLANRRPQFEGSKLSGPRAGKNLFTRIKEIARELTTGWSACYSFSHGLAINRCVTNCHNMLLLSLGFFLHFYLYPKVIV